MKNKKKNKSNFSSFIAGMGSILCIFPTTEAQENISDTQALKNDWKAIRSDFNKSFKLVSNELKNSKQNL